MTHLHKASGLTFECGELMEFPVCGVRKTYDMTVITLWGCTKDDLEAPIIVGYYFGEYNEETTDYYIERWLEEQAKDDSQLQLLISCYNIIEAYWLTNHEVLEEPQRTKVAATRLAFNQLLDKALNS